MIIGAELGSAAGARAPPLLHNPRKFIVYSIYSPKFPVPALYVVHLHYLEHFGASANILLPKSVPMTHPQISNEILCPYCHRYRDCRNYYACM